MNRIGVDLPNFTLPGDIQPIIRMIVTAMKSSGTAGCGADEDEDECGLRY